MRTGARSSHMERAVATEAGGAGLRDCAGGALAAPCKSSEQSIFANDT